MSSVENGGNGSREIRREEKITRNLDKKHETDNNYGNYQSVAVRIIAVIMLQLILIFFLYY